MVGLTDFKWFELLTYTLPLFIFVVCIINSTNNIQNNHMGQYYSSASCSVGTFFQ